MTVMSEATLLHAVVGINRITFEHFFLGISLPRESACSSRSRPGLKQSL